MEDYSHPAYSKLQEIGKEIIQKVKPKAVVVFSAHWQASPNTIEVNTAERTDLIYDYYGFPDHYYKVKYPNIGSKDIASRVLKALKTANIDAKGVSRGLDHGVFAPFTVAFDPKTNPLNVPLVQVSLFDSDDADQHYRLGEAMQGLREEGILVIVSGMAVHNLRDMWKAMQQPAPMPYSVSFDAALKQAVEQKVCLTLCFIMARKRLTDNQYSQKTDKRRWRICWTEVMPEERTHLLSICCLSTLVQELLVVITESSYGLCLKAACPGRNSGLEKSAMLQLDVVYTCWSVRNKVSVTKSQYHSNSRNNMYMVHLCLLSGGGCGRFRQDDGK